MIILDVFQKQSFHHQKQREAYKLKFLVAFDDEHLFF